MDSFKIENLTFSYPEQSEKALDNINLNIKSGDFIVICGKSGCGKSTLLRHLKTVLTPHGNRSGMIYFNELPLEKIDLKNQASEIGYVLQNPDNQIVTDKVWHELAFGLESLGYKNEIIRLRVAEMASFFGIQDWFLKNVTELSGGQKQLLNLASIMVMQPSVLILDEPTSQLDPIAATEFLQTVKKINCDLATTIIISEHRLDELFPMADKITLMDNGKISYYDSPKNVANELKEKSNDMFVAMPAPTQIFAGVTTQNNNYDCPFTIKDGRNWLNNLFENKKIIRFPKHIERDVTIADTVFELKNVWFKYEKLSPDIIKNLSIKIKKGQWHCIVGGNGTGKTTALTLMSGINKPYRGKVLLNNIDISKYSNDKLFTNNLGVLPQNPQALFVKKTVALDLMEMFSNSKISVTEKEKSINEIAKLIEITKLLQMHPYDLSGGEQQRVALAKILLLKPKILLLDEPTKGIDNHFKIKLAKILKELQQNGVTIIMVSHDIEFCAKYSDFCSLFFNGTIVATDNTKAFFSGNSFYTTAANRMSRNLFENAITNEDVINLCNQNLQLNPN